MSTMKRFLYIFVTVGLLTFSYVPLIGQTHGDFKKELSSLDGSRYVARAFEGAEILAQRSDYKNGLDLIDKAVKKARSLGGPAQAVIYFNKAELLNRAFPKNAEYSKEIVESVEKMMDKDPPISLMEQAQSICQSIPSILKKRDTDKLQKLLLRLESELSAKQQKLLVESKDQEFKEFKKLDREEAFEELEKLKSERERLEGLQQKLAESIDRSEAQLRRRTAMVNRMTQEQAKQEAIIQYNKRIIDSMRFMAQLDSINLISHERLINEQESQLELQESQLALKDSELKLKNSTQRLYIALSLFGLAIAGFLSWVAFSTRRTNRKLEAKNVQIEEENAQYSTDTSKGYESAFVTASDQLVREKKRKMPRHEPSSQQPSSNIKKKFQPPSSGTSMAQKATTAVNHDDDENVDPRLKGCDPKLIEKIELEIVDHGEPIRFEDISGLQFAKQCVNELVIYPMLRPDICTGLRCLPKGTTTIVKADGDRNFAVWSSGHGKDPHRTLLCIESSQMQGKALAYQAKATFFSISASSLTSKWVRPLECRPHRIDW